MVERVKDATARTARVVNDHGCPLLENPEEIARTAIQAMREPTREMIEAGVEATDTGNRNDECPRPREIEAAWRAGIDAALKWRSQ